MSVQWFQLIALIGGSFTNPTVKLDLGSTKKSLIDNVKDQAKEGSG